MPRRTAHADRKASITLSAECITACVACTVNRVHQVPREPSDRARRSASLLAPLPRPLVAPQVDAAALTDALKSLHAARLAPCRTRRRRRCQTAAASATPQSPHCRCLGGLITTLAVVVAMELELDHLVVAAATLQDGVDHVCAMVGCTPEQFAPEGKHAAVSCLPVSTVQTCC